MSRPLAVLTFLALVGTLTAQPPARKLPPPKVVEEGGKRVAVFEYGKTEPAVKVGELTFRILPLQVTERRIAIGYEVENRTNNTIKIAGKTPEWRTGSPSVFDDTGRKYAVPAGEKPGGQEGNWELFPERGNRSGFSFEPHIGPAAHTVTAEIVAPPGADVDRWRVLFPKRSWVPRWAAYDPKLPPLRMR